MHRLLALRAQPGAPGASPSVAEWLVAAGAGALAAALPLARTLGYESAMTLAIVAGLLALRRGLIEGRRLRPPVREAGTSAEALDAAARFAIVRREAGGAFARATVAPLVAVALPWAVLVVSTRIVQGCRAGPGSLLVLFLAVPAAAHFAALGLACGAATRSGAAAFGLIAAVAAANAIHSGSQALAGRTIPHSLPFGFLSGSGWGGVGRADLDLPVSYFLLRALAVALCPLAVTLAALGASRARRGSPSGPAGTAGEPPEARPPASDAHRTRSGHRARGGRISLAVSAVPALAACVFPSTFGLTTGTSARSAELSARTATPHCIVRFTPGGRAESTAARLAAKAEWDFQVDAAVMHLSDAAPVTVWVYDDAGQMRRLTGADEFLFALPWRREVHTLWTPEGADELRHELVHVLAADWTRRPLRISWNQALLEGTAESIASYAFLGGEFQKEAAAVLGAGRLPRATRLFSTGGFVWGSQSLRNAYRLSASFVGFLLERWGPVPLAAAYGGASWTDAYGKDLAALDAEWRARLAEVPVSPEERRRADSAYDPERFPAFHAVRCPRVGVANAEAETKRPSGAGAEGTDEGDARRNAARGLAMSARRSGKPADDRVAALALFRAGLAREAIDLLENPTATDPAGTAGASSGAGETGAASRGGGRRAASATELGPILLLLLLAEDRRDDAASRLVELRPLVPDAEAELYELVARSAEAPALADVLLLNLKAASAGETPEEEDAGRRRQRELLRQALRREPGGPAAWIAEEWLCAWPPAGTDGAGPRLLERFLDGAGRSGGVRAVRAALKLGEESLAGGRRAEAEAYFRHAGADAPTLKLRISAAEGQARARGASGGEFVGRLPSLLDAAPKSPDAGSPPVPPPAPAAVPHAPVAASGPAAGL